LTRGFVPAAGGAVGLAADRAGVFAVEPVEAGVVCGFTSPFVFAGLADEPVTP
jgi:hypothetical protein